jgi:translation initiation factor 1
MTKNNNRTVWSSDQGLPLSGVRREESKPRKIISVPPHQQTIYLHRDSKGRGGKSVTLVKNLILSEEDMKELAKRLKQVCGSGGTVKDSIIEIQGEHREKVAEELKKIGYKVKIAGG